MSTNLTDPAAPDLTDEPAVSSADAPPAERHDAATDTASSDAVRTADRAHVFYPWAAQGQLDPLPIERALGSYMWDYTGKRYLDFSSQLVNVNIGHQHPKLVAAIQEQAGKLCTIGPVVANDVRSEAARLIAEIAPGHLNKVYFTTGGAEAVENAIRMARIHTGRNKIFAAYRSYHGGTSGAVTLTGEPRRWASEPGIPGVVHFWGPYLYRSVFYATTPEEECERALQHLRDQILMEGPHTVAAIIMESVVGTNGILVPPDGYLAGIRAICDEFGIVYIADEVMAGFGRCGEWFAVEPLGRHARSDLLRQGHQLRLRPAGRRHHERRDRGDLRQPRVPGRSHLRRASAGVRVGGRLDRHLPRGGHRRERPPHRRRRWSVPGCAQVGREPPVDR